MNFYERHTLFHDAETVAKNEEVFARLLRSLPEKVMLSSHTGDWNMGSSDVAIRMNSPQGGWIDTVAIVHGFSDNNPYGGPHGTEIMLIDVAWGKGDLIRICNEFNALIEKFGGE